MIFSSCDSLIYKDFWRLRKEKAAAIDYACACSKYKQFRIDDYVLSVIPEKLLADFFYHLKEYRKLHEIYLKAKRPY